MNPRMTAMDPTSIRSALIWGFPDGPEPELPRCPVCGGQCEEIYKARNTGDIVGCDLCLAAYDPWEVLDDVYV